MGYFVLDTVWWLVDAGAVLLLTIKVMATIKSVKSPEQRLKQMIILVPLYFVPVYVTWFNAAFSDTAADLSFRVWMGVGAHVALTIGALTYAMHVPERWKTNFFFNGHAWMHVFINVAYLCEWLFVYDTVMAQAAA